MESDKILDDLMKAYYGVKEITGNMITGIAVHPAFAAEIKEILRTHYEGSWMGMELHSSVHIPRDRIVAFGPDGKIVGIFLLQDEPK